MTSHISLSHKEIRIIDDEHAENNKYYPSYDIWFNTKHLVL